MTVQASYRVIIPAAGRSSRSGLSYPKSLYRLNGIPIIVRICRVLAAYDVNPVVIINPAHENEFTAVFKEFDVHAAFAYQAEPLGMGHALLQASPLVAEDAQVILCWSDIPFLSPQTIAHVINCDAVMQNDLSLATRLCSECYTIVKREEGKLKAVIETRAAGLLPGKDGERDIGFFVFKKKPVFELMQQYSGFTEVNGKKEQGFLYIIEKLVEAGYKAEGYPVALDTDVLSFNTPEDLTAIEEALRLRKTL